MWIHRLSHVHQVTGHTVQWLDNHMDVVLVHQYEAVWWQQQLHQDEVSAANALAMAFAKSPPRHRSVVSLAGEPEQELV